MNDDGSFTFGYVAEDGSFRYSNLFNQVLYQGGKLVDYLFNT